MTYLIKQVDNFTFTFLLQNITTLVEVSRSVANRAYTFHRFLGFSR